MPKLSRRSLLRNSGAYVLAVSAGAMALPNSAAAKVSKREAGYQPRPRGRQSCMNCKFFRHGCRGANCTVVAGRVSPMGWCQLWAR